MNKQEAALKMVLMFHSGKDWKHRHRLEWNQLATQVMGMKRIRHNGESALYEATTKVLCDAVRSALGKRMCFGDDCTDLFKPRSTEDKLCPKCVNIMFGAVLS